MQWLQMFDGLAQELPEVGHIVLSLDGDETLSLHSVYAQDGTDVTLLLSEVELDTINERLAALDAEYINADEDGFFTVHFSASADGKATHTP